MNDNSGDVLAFANSVVGTSANLAEYGLDQQGEGVNILVATLDSQVTLQIVSGGGAGGARHLTTLVISVLADVNGGCRFVAYSLHSSPFG